MIYVLWLVNRIAARQWALMASLSKCHSCHQYHYTAGKQHINILTGEISAHSGRLQADWDLCLLQLETIWCQRHSSSSGSVPISNLISRGVQTGAMEGGQLRRLGHRGSNPIRCCTELHVQQFQKAQHVLFNLRAPESRRRNECGFSHSLHFN